jgi:alpha-L-fucosidase
MQHKKDWFKDRKWGIFTHYRSIDQNSTSPTGMMLSLGKGETSWDECVNEFDVEKYAKSVNEIKAGYVIFTLMQGTRFMCAPNETYNVITGYKTGEACSARDLIADLLTALKEYDIPLFLYFTGDGPYKDMYAGRAFGLWDRQNQNVSEEFVEKWASVAEEYSQRYKDGISGWWVDGCYAEMLGYYDELIKILADAMRAGNPDSLLTFNNGVDRFERYSEHEDYLAGETTEFSVYPDQRFTDGSQRHVLSFLGYPSEYYDFGNPAWNRPGSKYSGKELREYVKKVNNKGGVVSIDVCTFRDGSIDNGQLEVLKHLRDLE